jgi:hypothetical protein
VTAVQSCRGCGKLFPFLPRGLCADCIDLREERFQTVREWLQDNPSGASISAASKATDVTEGLIGEFIREGRLQFAGAESESVKDRQAREALREKLIDEMTAKAESERRSAQQVRRGMRSRI